MPLVCIGSINADYIYRVPHLPRPGETLAAHDVTRMLGGKGANQSIAATLAGGQVAHVGAVGADGDWMRDALIAKGVSVADVTTVAGPSGHAIIAVDDQAENSILLLAGSNHCLTAAQITDALSGKPGIVMLQNETNLTVFAAQTAQARGWKVLYSAAPFDVSALSKIAVFSDFVLLNEVEAAQWQTETRKPVSEICQQVIVTRGAAGCVLIVGDQQQIILPPKVNAVDTTGAGDTFAGVFAQGLASLDSIVESIGRAQIAAALQVTRFGTSEAMPTAAEIASFTN